MLDSGRWRIQNGVRAKGRPCVPRPSVDVFSHTTMKTLALAALLAASLAAPFPAEEEAAAMASAPAADESSADAPADDDVVERYVALHEGATASFRALGKSLAGVKDKASADAAVPAVREATDALLGMLEEADDLGGSPEAQRELLAAEEEILKRVNSDEVGAEIAETVIHPAVDLLMQEPSCYGSEGLATELAALLDGLMPDEGDFHGPGPMLEEPDADEEEQSEEER